MLAACRCNRHDAIFIWICRHACIGILAWFSLTFLVVIMLPEAVSHQSQFCRSIGIMAKCHCRSCSADNTAEQFTLNIRREAKLTGFQDQISASSALVKI